MLRQIFRSGKCARSSYENALRQGTLCHSNSCSFASTRVFSTAETADMKESIETLDRATAFILSQKKSPLGTIDVYAWDDVISVMNGWLKRDEWTSDLEPNNTLSGYSVDASEKLLVRLIQENATTKPGSILRHQRDMAIASWQSIILNSWIDVAALQQHDHSTLAATSERAESALGRIVDLYNEGGFYLDDTSDQDPLPVSSFVKLCRLWLALDNLDGLKRSVDLLITWTEGEQDTSLLDSHKSDVAQCFNEAMNQCTNLLRRQDEKEPGDNGDIGRTAEALVARMDLLRTSAGWDDLDSPSALARKMVLMSKIQGSPDETKTINPNDDKSRQFEEAAMFQQMIHLIRDAGDDDTETILQEVIPRLMESKNIPAETLRDISTALVDFFIRINDAKRATQFFQRFEVIDAAMIERQEDPMTKFNRLRAIFRLWTDNEDGSEDNIWRAEELLLRCEAIVGRRHDEMIPLHLKMLRLWSKYTRDADLAARKVCAALAKFIARSSHETLEGFELSDVRMVVSATNASGGKSKLEPNEVDFLLTILETRKSDSSEDFEQALMQLAESQKSNITPELQRRFEELASTLPSGSEVSKSLRKGIIQSSLSDLSETSSTSKRIQQIKKLGGFDENQRPGWDLESYNTAIALLLENQHGDKRSFDAAKKVLDVVFAGLAEEEGRVAQVLSRVLDQCVVSHSSLTNEKKRRKFLTKRTALAEEILIMAENRFLSMDPENLLGETAQTSPITLQNFGKVLQGYYETGQAAEFERTFLRLYNYFRIGGYQNLLPDRFMLTLYLDCVLQTRKDGKELESILNEWISHCKDAGRDVDSCADENIYDTIFRAHETQKDASLAVRFATQQLEAMKAGQADAELASFVMEKAIQTAADSKSDDLYHLTVEKLFRKYGMDERLQITLPSTAWRDLLYASSKKAPRNQLAFASKISIMAITELRKAGKADEWAYISIVLLHVSIGGPQSREVLRTVFQICCDDGRLSPVLKAFFRKGFPKQVWHEIYTSKLLPPNAEEPAEWSANVAEAEFQH